MSKSFSLFYEGYWLDGSFSGVPEYAGVYSFMECSYNITTNKVSLVKLLYIGQAQNLRDRISNHDKLAEMRRSVKFGNYICVNVAEVYTGYLYRVENALIFEHNPPFNTLLKHTFDYDMTTINSSGNHKMIQSNFTVVKPPVFGFN